MRVKNSKNRITRQINSGKSHKKTRSRCQKTHTRKSPYFAAGRLRRTVHISASNLMKVRRQNMSKKISPLRGEIIFCGAPGSGRHTDKIK